MTDRQSITKQPTAKPAPRKDDAGGSLSVVVPLFRNADSVAELAGRLKAALDPLIAERRLRAWELILVVDGCPEGSLEAARAVAVESSAVRVIDLARNIGQQRAVLVGLAAARGDWMVIMDGDLQDPPEALPGLLAARGPGIDAVFAARRGRYQSRGRHVTSRLFKMLLARVAGVPADAGIFVAISRPMRDALLGQTGRHTSVVAMIGLSGLRHASVPVTRARRARGRSAYRGTARLRAGVNALVFAIRGRVCHGSGVARTATALGWGVAAATVAFLLLRHEPFRMSDEGFRLLLARAWLEEESLFTRFRLLYLPGETAWFSLFVRCFGGTLGALRLAGAILLGAASVMLYATLRRWIETATADQRVDQGVDHGIDDRGDGGHTRASRALAALPAVVAMTVAVVTPAEPKLLAMAIVVAFTLRLFAPPDPSGRLVIAAGWCCGLLAAVREDSAVLLAAVTVALAARRRPIAIVTRAMPAIIAGFLPWVVWFTVRGEMGPFLDHLLHRYTFLVTRLASPTTVDWARVTAIPSALESRKAQLFSMTAWMPPALYACLAIGAWVTWRRRGTVDGRIFGAALLGFAYLPQFLWERADLRHFRAHLPVFLVALVAVALMVGRDRVGTRRGLTRLVCASMLAMATVSLGWHFVRRHYETATPYPTIAARAIGASVVGSPPVWAGLPSRPGETLIVLTWGPGWYLLEDLPPGTRQLSTFARHVDRPGVIAELIDDLIRPTNRWVLSRRRWPVPTAVVERVHECYRKAGDWWDWELWERSGCNGTVSP